MSTADIVDVSISVQDTIPKTANFGICLILAYHTVDVGMLTYDATPNGLAAMVTDGFATTDDVYRKASAIAAQNPGVTTFKVFPRAAPNAQTIRLTPTSTQEGFVYRLNVNGTAIEYEVPAAATIASVCTALEALIEPATNVSSSDDTTHITLTLTSSTGTRIYIKDIVREITVKDMSVDAGIADDLAAAQLADPDWYGLLIDSQGEAEINAAATWVEANSKLFIAQCADSDIVTSSTTDVASDVKGAGYHRTDVLFTRDMAGMAASGLMSRQFSRNPGTSTYHLKQIAGATADNLTPTELGHARGKNATVYVTTDGVNHTFDGKAGSGRFLDITHGTDWLMATMASDVFTVLLNQEKVDFDDNGIGLVESAMRARLQIAEDRRFLKPGWTVTMPKAANVSTADKGNRLLADPTFHAELRGAIHKTVINGTLTL